MALKDLLKKKEKITAASAEVSSHGAHVPDHPIPEFTFMRSDTNTQELISPPTFGPDTTAVRASDDPPNTPSRLSRLVSRSRKSSYESSARKSTEKAGDEGGAEGLSRPGTAPRRLSQRLGLRRSPTSSRHVPTDLPAIVPVCKDEGGTEARTDAEAQWEERATILARENERSIGSSMPSTSGSSGGGPRYGGVALAGGGDGDRVKRVASEERDEDIQEAIRLHEAGNLEASTEMFGRLADPAGRNNALSQVLYGLALR